MSNVLPCTQENLNLLLSQYENKIEKLDHLLPSYKFQNYYWHGFRNRFFDVRWDNHHYNTYLKTKCKCEPVNGIQICHCDDDLCSEGTYEEEYFITMSCPKTLIYEHIPKTNKTPFDGVEDKYKLRIHRSYDHDCNSVLSIKSIPIIALNLQRLDKELERQESLKWSLALIRCRPFLGLSWFVENEKTEKIEIYLPRDVLPLILYWCKF